MCAITGLVNKNGVTIDLDLLKRMNRLAAHRGPDGEDYFQLKNIGFGHRRLAIFDLSDFGKQPMHYLHLTIVFNGAIYNYLELRQELIVLGYVFDTNTDTEVILKAFHYWGIDCFSKLNGMWALAIYNNLTGEIIGCRDRLGMKPFYYTNSDTSFAFGSEIKQLLPVQSAIVNWPILMDYLVYNLESHSEETFFKNIMVLPAAHYFVFNIANYSFNQQAYYYWPINETKLNDIEIEKQFNELLNASINIHLRADVPLGACLSGGLDSSVITQLALKKLTAPLSVFTSISTDKTNNDELFASEMVNQNNLNWHTDTPTIDNFKKNLESLIYCQEEPFYSTSNFMQFSLMSFVKKTNIKVLLDGQGADELLMGYTKYLSLPYPNLLRQSYLKDLHNMANNNNKSYLSIITEAIILRNFWIRNIRLKFKFRNLKNKYFKLPNTLLAKQWSSAFTNINKLQLLELKFTQLPKLLKYADKNAMYFGLESRLPFLDYRLVSLCLQIPIHLKLNNGWTKYILRITNTGIPKSIAWRKNKIGFESPEKNWLDNKWMQEEINNSPIIKELFNKIPPNPDKHLLWKLFNIALWQKKFNVSL
jgi:asparagine synthase (glutamine-hydrolysing)